MKRFMCNVCGKSHNFYGEAVWCHPDVVIKQIDGIAGTHGPTLRAPDQSEQKSALELPEWYQMAKEFFDEVRVFSINFYDDMSGESILTQLRYAAEREAKSQISTRSVGG